MKQPYSVARLGKTPIFSRTLLTACGAWALALGAFGAFGALGAFGAPEAHAQETIKLTEVSVIRLAQTRDPDALAAREAIAVAAAREVEAGLYPNPVLAWDREHIPGAQGESEDAIAVSVELDLSGRRAARRALARADVARARSDAARSQSAAVTRALLVFYAALAAERRVDIASQVVRRLDEAARVLGSRRAAGTVSGYEHTRLEIEAELGRSALREAEAHAAALRGELALLLGLGLEIQPAAIALQGDLDAVAISSPAATRPSIDQPDATRPSISLARKAADQARQARSRAGRAWVPNLELTGGLKIAAAEDTRYGYVAGIALSLPIFSRGQALRAEADAKRRLADAEVKAAEQTARVEVARATAALTMANRERARFAAETSERVDRLLRAAESGYREGHRTIVELLDAQRAFAAVAERRLELSLAARRAEIALRAARGEFE